SVLLSNRHKNMSGKSMGFTLLGLLDATGVPAIRVFPLSISMRIWSQCMRRGTQSASKMAPYGVSMKRVIKSSASPWPMDPEEDCNRAIKVTLGREEQVRRRPLKSSGDEPLSHMNTWKECLLRDVSAF